MVSEPTNGRTKSIGRVLHEYLARLCPHTDRCIKCTGYTYGLRCFLRRCGRHTLVERDCERVALLCLRNRSVRIKIPTLADLVLDDCNSYRLQQRPPKPTSNLQSTHHSLHVLVASYLANDMSYEVESWTMMLLSVYSMSGMTGSVKSLPRPTHCTQSDEPSSAPRRSLQGFRLFLFQYLNFLQMR